MQSYKFNNMQCKKTPCNAKNLGAPRIPHIIHSKPWTPYAAKYFIHINKLSVSCTALNTDDRFKSIIGRKIVDYNPSSVWGDYFATYTLPNLKSMEWMEQRINELKKEVKVMFKSTKKMSALMNLVDTIEHLGISYHFINEIDNALNYLHDVKLDNEDLQHVALRFRLLRQHGFKESSGNYSMLN